MGDWVLLLIQKFFYTLLEKFSVTGGLGWADRGEFDLQQ